MNDSVGLGGERFTFRKELKESECEEEKIAKIECRDSSARFVVPNVGPLSEGFERSVASPLQPRRLRAMGRTV
jgi:hypothetical protein